jgi:hypothetical protein
LQGDVRSARLTAAALAVSLALFGLGLCCCPPETLSAESALQGVDCCSQAASGEACGLKSATSPAPLEHQGSLIEAFVPAPIAATPPGFRSATATPGARFASVLPTSALTATVLRI